MISVLDDEEKQSKEHYKAIETQYNKFLEDLDEKYKQYVYYIYIYSKLYFF